MAAKTFTRLENGKLKSQKAIISSTGAANDGDLIALDSTGRIDPSVLPVGVGPDIKVIEATEALNAGDYVNIFNDGGTEKVRLADNSNSRDAHGFVKDAASIAANASVYFEGPNDDLSGLTPGQRVYLGTAGQIISVPLDPNTEGGKIHQFLGIAIDATTVNTDIDDCILLA